MMVKQLIQSFRTNKDKKLKDDWSFGSDNQKRIMEFQKENYQNQEKEASENIVNNNKKYFFDSNIYRSIFVHEKQNIND